MDIQNLLALQQEDGRIRDLERELHVIIPRRRAEASARLRSARDKVEEAEQKNIAAQREIDRLRHDYTHSRAMAERAERNAMGLTGARALEAAMNEHAGASANADAAQVALSRSDLTPTERALDDARAEEAAVDADVQAISDMLDARKKIIADELDKARARRDECIPVVPPAQLAYYERLKLTRWPCIVDYNRAEGVCTGCNLVQPPSVTQAVLQADKDPAASAKAHGGIAAGMVTCPHCGRILK